MTKMDDFVISKKGDVFHVDRNFNMPNNDTLSMSVKVGFGAGSDPAITEIHRASLDAVIRFLLTRLPEGFDSANPYKAGPKK